jgi:hypothetical protein
MKHLLVAALALGFVGLVSTARAAEDPNGTWKWTTMFGEKSVEASVKLKLDGDKLTGAYIGRGGMETPIENGTFKDGKVSFAVTRMFGDNKFTIKYNGTLSGDVIKGKTEFTGQDGQAQSRDWEAKRQK